MSVAGGPYIVENGLVMCLDAASQLSYPGSGTIWYDVSNNGNYGTLINGPTFTSSNNGCFVFNNGISDYRGAYVVTQLYQTTTNPYSIMAWIQNSSNSGGSIMNCGTNNVDDIGLSFGYSNPLLLVARAVKTYYYGSGQMTIPWTGNLAVGWHHVAMTIGAAGTYLYVDSAVLSSTPDTAPLSTPSFPWTLSLNGTLSAFPGGSVASYTMNGSGCKIGAAMYYNRQLSSLEILQNYNAQKSRFGLS
jgi:Concanavalin A-like lectin/glucanases superfamily